MPDEAEAASPSPLEPAGAAADEDVVTLPLALRPPAALPATEIVVRRAVEWATDQVGSTAYALRCLAFVEDAYELPNGIEVFNGSSASESAEIHGAALAVGEPEVGAFVFFETSGPDGAVQRDWGHVGLAIGGGRIVHAWPVVRVDAIVDVPLLPTGGWTAPRPIGWASPEAILQGARLRGQARPRSDRDPRIPAPARAQHRKGMR